VPETIQTAKTALKSVTKAEMMPLHPIASHYDGIEQRGLVVYSEQAWHREVKQLQKKVAQAAEAA